MTGLAALVDYCSTLLEVERYHDYCPNGLQVEGRPEVRRIVSGVTACQALVDAAVEAEADLLLVHHGWFWRGEAEPLVGIKRRRIKALLAHDISLLAYHLPLDGHPLLGNNAQLGGVLGVSDAKPFLDEGLGRYADYQTPIALSALTDRLEQQLGQRPLAIDGGRGGIRRIAWCSGAAQGYIEQAAALGVDAYLSGEISEQTVHLARELGIHYIAAGHHATERGGVRALGEHLAERFELEHQFVDIPNPV